MSKKHFKIDKGTRHIPQAGLPADPENGDIVYDSSLEKFRAYENGVWIDIINTSQGGLNYIEDNPDAELNTTGWVAYADAAGVDPVDGTAGSPTTTITRDTTAATIVRGTASFKITKDAANRQGEGVSFDFTIDNQDKGKKLNISFEYTPTTNYASSDINVWIYDVTNAALIAVQNDEDAFVLDSSGFAGFAGQFIAATDSTSYRLIIHISTTNATAYDIFFDNVKVTPDIGVPGAIITDTLAFTPTWNGLTIGDGTESWQYQRVGDLIHIEGSLTFGSTTSISGAVNMDNPAASTTITSLNASKMNAPVYLFDNTTSTNREIGSVRIVSNTLTLFTVNGSAVNTTVPFTWAISDSISFSAWFKIDEWTAGAIISSTETNNQTIRAILTKSGTQSIADNSTTQKITSMTIDLDTHNAISSDVFTAPRDGEYMFIMATRSATGGGWGPTEQWTARIYKNSVLEQEFRTLALAAHTTGMDTDGAIVLTLAKDDAIEFRQFQNSGGALDLTLTDISIVSLPDFTNFASFSDGNHAGNLIISGQAGSPTNALVDEANISTDCDLGNVHSVTLTDNRTLDNPTNLKDGFTYIWRITQDGGGTNTLAYGSAFKFEGGVAPILSTGGGDVDILSGISDGTNIYTALSKDFS